MSKSTKRKKIFILGVGAQKAGTTWLYEQLCKNPNVDMGFLKEYHVFDAIFSPLCSFYRDSILDTITDRRNKGSLGVNTGDNLVKQLSFIDNTENYFEYFDYLHSRNKHIEAVGDVTPSYSMLNSNCFEHIKQGLENKGFNVKVIFIMRDPFERIWSMLRMTRKLERENGVSPTRTESDLIYEFSKTEGCELRTRYENTTLQLERTFDPNSIFYGLYETFFREESYRAFSNFLDIKIATPDFYSKVNESKNTEEIEIESVKKVVSHYRKTYEFAFEKFGPDTKKIWNNFRFL